MRNEILESCRTGQQKQPPPPEHQRRIVMIENSAAVDKASTSNELPPVTPDCVISEKNLEDISDSGYTKYFDLRL